MCMCFSLLELASVEQADFVSCYSVGLGAVIWKVESSPYQEFIGV